MTRRSAAVPPTGARVARARAAAGAVQTARQRLSWLAYPLVVVIAVGIVAAGQLVEDLADNSANHLLAAPLAGRRWALIAVALYGLVITRVVDMTVRRSLVAVRRAVRIDATEFSAYEARMNHRELRVELVALLASTAITVGIFIGLGVEPLNDEQDSTRATHLPAEPAAAALVLAGYIVLGWVAARLLIVTLRLASLLGRLSRERLHINVFDTVNLLPFGNIAIAVALAPAGIVAILLIGLGAPRGILGWIALVFATLASVLGILLPLRGVHRQMYTAKDEALQTLNARITEVYDDVAQAPGIAPDQAARVNHTTTALLNLRKTVHEMTTWPFRDTVALARALLIASAPLIYTTLSEFIKILLGR